MMPSRGFVRAKAPHLFQLQCRNLSSAGSRRILQRPILTAPPTHPTQWRTSTPFLIGSIGAYRNASTSSPTATPIEKPSDPTPEAPYPNMDTITLDNIDLSNPEVTSRIAALPERIGYLHDIGLDHGWGPSSMVQWVIEHVHIYGGLPWWGSICATAILLRLALLPLFIKSSDVQARQSAITPLTQPLMEKMQALRREGKTDETALVWREVLAIRKSAGVSFRAQFMPILVQGFFGVGGFISLRKAAALPVPAFLTEGPGWIADMTVPDPYLILPLAMAGTIHLIMRWGGETGATPLQGGMKTFALYGMPLIILVGVGWQSAAVALWFASGSAVGILQSQLLMRSWVRERLGIAPTYKPTEKESGGSPWSRFTNIQRGSTGPTTPESPTREAGMGPTYQAPTLRTSPSVPSRNKPSTVIDVRATTHSSTSTSSKTSGSKSTEGDVTSPSSSKPQSAAKSSQGNVLKRAAAAYKDLSSSGSKYMADRRKDVAERNAQRERDSIKAAAKTYEKRAQEMERRRRG